MFEFTKLQGAGNDFIVVNNYKLKLEKNELKNIAKQLCKRRISVGADGFMAVDEPKDGGDFKMLFFNADGTEGEMCGNGARCIAKFAYDEKIAKEKMIIETTAGKVFANRLESDLYKIKLNNPTKIVLDLTLDIDEIAYSCDYIELGDPGLPHVALLYKGLENTSVEELLDLGKKIRYHKSFPKGANVNFYDVLDKNKLIIKTFERGVEDFTLACGTGVGSVTVATALKGITDKNTDTQIEVMGGTLFTKAEFSEYEDVIANLYLTGKAETVYMGNIVQC